MTEIAASSVQCGRCGKEWPAPYNFVIINGRCPWCPRDPMELAVEKHKREYCRACGQRIVNKGA